MYGQPIFRAVRKVYEGKCFIQCEQTWMEHIHSYFCCPAETQSSCFLCGRQFWIRVSAVLTRKTNE